MIDYVFYQVAAINGFDSFGHYLRAGLIVNTCSTYSIDAGSAARRTSRGRPATRRRDASTPRATGLQRTPQTLAEALGPAEPKPVEAKPKRARRRGRAGAARSTPRPRRRRRHAGAGAPRRRRAGPAQTDALLDYLFGDDG